MSNSSIYDQRYLGDYRERLSGYEIARWEALEHFITRILKLGWARKVLDYGAGSGLHVGLWEKTFPGAELHFCDISQVAMEKFKNKYPRHADSYYLVRGNQPAGEHNAFDVVVSVEVMEHVDDLDFYLSEIERLLKPGGYFVWTTPCANPFSIEHIYSALTGGIVQTGEGYRKWIWEDPTHLRRLRSSEIAQLLRQKGFSDVRFRFRSHFFSFVATYLPTNRAQRLRNRMMVLDYLLFRRLPNGASMIGGAKKISA
ncbi:MAG: class I SAM-dependent methyltransferase [Chloroflexi bacterium]|nr:class I SAM-dependent methyltransferase [Chloroflexota bacterium]